MQIGIFAPTTDYAAPTPWLAKACEQRGFESFWVPEHTHIPVSRRSPFPGGGELPNEYSHLNDPFVMLAAAAAVTERIKLGTGICLVVEHDPIVLAKQIASLDRLSNGRFLFGIGAGWNLEEMADHGTDPKTRWLLLKERIEAMKQIWTEEEAEYHGQFVNFDRLWSWPKPSQKPHPPILLGSGTARSRQRVVEAYDGWIPIGMSTQKLAEGIADVRRLARERGRDPDSIEISFFWPRPEAEALQKLRDLGLARAVLAVPASTDLDKLSARLDRYAELAKLVQ
ncbi:MAG TPA: LLM class F420-dependent oxidoreductase [Polyangiales bacterium]|nr:LLM class F420-dependent oxidoreductase [Polyangiales bacterium]